MGIPIVVYPLFNRIRSLQISHERDKFTNAVTHGIDKLAALYTGIGDGSPICFCHECRILSLVVGIKIITIVNHIIDVVDYRLCNDNHGDGYNCSNDGENNGDDLENDGQGFQCIFHNDTSKYLNEVSGSDSSFLLH